MDSQEWAIVPGLYEIMIMGEEKPRVVALKGEVTTSSGERLYLKAARGRFYNWHNVMWIKRVETQDD